MPPAWAGGSMERRSGQASGGEAAWRRETLSWCGLAKSTEFREVGSRVSLVLKDYARSERGQERWTEYGRDENGTREGGWGGKRALACGVI